MNELFVFQNVLDVSERLDEWNDAKSERAGVGEELPKLDLAERRRMPQDGMTPIRKLVLVFKQQGVDLVARETVQPRVEIIHAVHHEFEIEMNAADRQIGPVVYF